jgi:hypothetical protein
VHAANDSRFELAERHDRTLWLNALHQTPGAIMSGGW